MQLVLLRTIVDQWESEPKSIHPKVDLNVSGNNAHNYHAHGGIGAGAVVHRSKNDRHSIGRWGLR
ncbi:hypothetical protein Avbf_14521 [Armadillidium vulgare]|nr:hypothetical protein Avbf_14521 [Armadillidium vulgare]